MSKFIIIDRCSELYASSTSKSLIKFNGNIDKASLFSSRQTAEAAVAKANRATQYNECVSNDDNDVNHFFPSDETKATYLKFISEKTFTTDLMYDNIASRKVKKLQLEVLEIELTIV